MKVLVTIVAWILAINIAYAAWLALSEFVRGRRTRREVGALHEMWQLPEVPRGARRRPTRVLAGALAVVVLGGVAIATPAGETVVTTVRGVIGDLRGEPEDEDLAAPTDDDGALSSPDGTPTLEPSTSAAVPDDRRDPARRNGGGPGEPTDGSGGRDPTPSPATSPDEEVAPPVDPSPSPTTAPEPSTPPPAVGTFASSAAAVSDTQIAVTWERVSSATGYEVHRSDGGGAPVLVEELSAGKREVVASGLAADTTYEFTVTAESSGDVLATSTTSATTLPAES